VINERQVVVYSTKYDLKSKYERQVLIEKAEEQIMSFSKEAKNSNYGANKYVKKALLDKQTGEVKTKGQVYVSSLDEEKIDNDEKYDGYYVLCTNVIGLEEWEKPFGKSHRYTKDGFFQLNKPVTAEDILEIYHGLWRIEETFKVTKSALRTRPVYVWTEEHIRSHFLICFVTLLLFRLLQKRLDWKYSAETIQETLSKASGTLVDNVYIFDHFDEPLKDIGKNLGIDFSRQNLTVGEVRSLLAYVKQSS
jgi:transposase